jgi:hypothetical protein
MSATMDSFVCKILLARHPASSGVGPDRWRWRRLVTALHDPYRPELHYMRGPGPKWRAKHAQHGRLQVRVG